MIDHLSLFILCMPLNPLALSCPFLSSLVTIHFFLYICDRHNFYMHWETKKFVCPAILQYWLYCGGLELSTQDL